MNTPRPNVNFRRFKSALSLKGRTLCEVAKTSGRSLRHVLYVLEGKRPGSDRVYQALRSAVGEPGWLFVTGQIDTLHDEVASHAAA